MTSAPRLERTLSRLRPFEGRHLGSGAEFSAYLEQEAATLARRRAREISLAETSESFSVDGWCALCARRTRFWVDRAYGYPLPGMRWLAPNWRERLACEHCQLNSRMRAALHYLLAFGQPLPAEPLYITEQSTPLFAELRSLIPDAIGSEFLGSSIPPGKIDERGLRNESLTHLSFEDARLRFLLSFDVLEHVAETDAALGECARVLQPGGWLIFTAPFDVHRETTLRRASHRPDGSLIHHWA